MTNGLILLSAGGTGGHLFPAEALAHVLVARGYRVHLATDERAERFTANFPAEKIHIIRSATIASKNPLAIAKAGWQLFKGMQQSRKIMLDLKPVAVVGFGGYPTVPPLLAASRAGIATVVHEQNAVMGRANGFLADRVSAIATGFPLTGGKGVDRAQVTGNPVRPSVLDAANMPFDPPAKGGTFRLLVFGGSQGARYFSEVTPEAFSEFSKTQLGRLEVTQQARPEDVGALQKAYDALGVRSEIAPFFDDMAARIAKAHLIVSRAGASTVSELAVIGRPSILVPYPFALDHDQAANAALLAESGGAEIVKQDALSPERLRTMLESAMDDAEGLENTAKSAKKTGIANAAERLADLVVSLT